MEVALDMAQVAASMGEVPVGAAVTRGEEVLARAGNRRERDQDPTAHAELLAIRAAAERLGSWRLEGCSLYVTLEPCAMCAGAMVLARLERCVYGASDPKGGFLGSVGDLSSYPSLNHRFQVVGGVCAEESAQMLRAFFRELRGHG